MYKILIRQCFLKKALCFLLIGMLIISNASLSYAQALSLSPTAIAAPAPTTVLRGLKVYPQDPFRFDFVVEHQQETDKDEANRLIKYFLASLTIPEQDLWVNLSPYEKDRIVPESFGQTEMGRDLLAQDYVLKQITSSLMNPQEEVGKAFWEKIYQKAQEEFGTTDIPIDTFNKVWIVPAKAVVYENAQSKAIYIVESKLNVMLETDYLAESKNAMPIGGHNVDDSLMRRGASRGAHSSRSAHSSQSDSQSIAQEILKEIIIPVLEKEVNEGASFKMLRQIYHSLILATWYKNKIKESLLSKGYVDQNKTHGIRLEDNLTAEEKIVKAENIWQDYVELFKKGVYNFIQEENINGEIIPKQYFSGGKDFTATSKLLEITQDSSQLEYQKTFDKIEVALNPLHLSEVIILKAKKDADLFNQYFFKRENFLPAGSQGISLKALNPLDSFDVTPDLFMYGYPVDDRQDTIAIRGCFISPYFSNKGLLRPFLDIFFKEFPQARQTAEDLIIPAVNILLMQEYGFRPPEGMKPNAWVSRKERTNGRRDMVFADEKIRNFTLKYMPANILSLYFGMDQVLVDGQPEPKQEEYYPLYLGVPLTKKEDPSQNQLMEQEQRITLIDEISQRSLNAQEQAIIRFLDAPLEERVGLVDTLSGEAQRILFAFIDNESGQPLTNGKVFEHFMTLRKLQQIRGDKAHRFLQEVQLLQLQHPTLPFTYMGLSRKPQDGAEPIIFVKETKDFMPQLDLTHVLSVNISHRSDAYVTEFFFVNGVYVGYGVTVVNTENFDDLEMLFHMFEKTENSMINRKTIPGLSKHVFEARLNLWKDLLPQGVNAKILIEKHQYSTRHVPTFYLRDIKTVQFKPVALYANQTPNYDQGIMAILSNNTLEPLWNTGGIDLTASSISIEKDVDNNVFDDWAYQHYHHVLEDSLGLNPRIMNVSTLKSLMSFFK